MKYRIKIKRDFGLYGWYDEKTRTCNRRDGFVVTNASGGCNVMPGAAWFKTIADAFRGIEALIEAGDDSQKFYDIFRSKMNA